MSILESHLGKPKYSLNLKHQTCTGQFKLNLKPFWTNPSSLGGGGKKWRLRQIQLLLIVRPNIKMYSMLEIHII